MAIVEWSEENGAWLVENQTLDDIELAAWRDGWIDDWEQELIDLAHETLGEDDEDEIIVPAAVAAFGLAFGVAIASMTISAYVSGRGGAGSMTTQDLSSLRANLEKQEQFATAFVDEIKSGNVTRKAAASRAGMYAGNTAAAFEQGKASQRDFIPPMLPGVDCKGLTRCRCYWKIVTYADRIEATWIAKGDAETCNPCAEHAIQWAPYEQSRG